MNLNLPVKMIILAVSTLVLSAFPAHAKNYIYVDGSNNEYTITSDSLIYDPITPVESSSGDYSGGEAKRVKISEDQFSKIKTLIRSIIKDKSHHETTRQMGCGTLVINRKKFYINSSSPLKEKLEAELKLYLE